jgi:flagellar hook assembly protein FlgD/outer membrane protein OmpA-like peptidoglycan-associated protein
MKSFLRTVWGLAFLACSALVFAYNPPSGGESIADWYSPLLLGGGSSVSSSEGPASDALNPAASAVQQRLTLDANYLALVGLGDENGWGSVGNLGASIPTPYGVWGAGMRILSTPNSFVSMPLGTAFSLRATFAKDLFPNFWIGLGLSSTLGSKTAFDWSLGADLGVIHSLGDISFMKNFHYGAVLAGLGKWYAPGTDSTLPGSIDTAFPSPFTLRVGAGFDFFKTRWGKLAATADLSFPFFQNLIFNTGAKFTFMDRVSLDLGWGVNLREAISGAGQSLYPSLALSASFPITTSNKSDSFLSKQGWGQSEIQPSFAFKPLYNGIYGFGFGATLPLGVVDKKAPRIVVAPPATNYDKFYMSPNADGKNDALVLPITVSDERYVNGYTLKIVDADGKVVRQIANKETRPEDATFQNILKRLGYVKKGVNVPTELTWDGRSDSGETVKDGTYKVILSAIDDNGNQGESPALEIAVDSTPPTLTVTPPADASGLVFSPDGDGNKDTLTIKASGSVEDEWKVEVKDIANQTVRTFIFKDSALQDIVWDGKNDSGQMVPDGIYHITFTCSDRALNSVNFNVDNIIIDTRQPPVSLSIDTNYFSPNNDGVKDVVTLSPGVPVKAGLSAWDLVVKDSSGAERWKLSGVGADGLKSSFEFNGKDSAGNVMPEGTYQATLSVKYVNGHKPSISSPNFTLDVTPPTAKVSSDVAVFSPNGDGKQDEVTFSEKASAEDLWTGEIMDKSGAVLSTFRFNGSPDEKLVWDGMSDSGTRVPDGSYRYRLRSTDKAGNTGYSTEISVTLDTEKKNLMLSSDLRAFSPNADGLRDQVTFTPTVQAPLNVAEWKFEIDDANQAAVKKLSSKAKVPEKFVWDGKADSGKVVPDGAYSASLWVRYNSGDEITAQVSSLLVDTVAPSIDIAASPLLFSPDGDGKKDAVTITNSKPSADQWETVILNSSGKTVKTFAWKGLPDIVTWDGTDDAGNKLPDGAYKYQASATDKAGNKTTKSIDGIKIDTRETGVFVTASVPGFSPNGDGRLDTEKFNVIVKLTDGLSAWDFSLKDQGGQVRKTFKGDASGLPREIVWDGKADDGQVYQGTYVGTFTAHYAKGDEPQAQTSAVTLDTLAPDAKLALNPIPFSPDNDGVDDEVNINISVQDLSDIQNWKLEIFEAAVEDSPNPDKAAKRRLFMKYEGQGKPAPRVTWDGKSLKGELVEAATDYPYEFTITDALGNATVVKGVIPVDVLVVRDGDRLKIKVPSIVFRPGAADFNNLAQDIVDKNYYVLKRIAAILNKYKSYRVTIEGHANSISKIYDYSAEKTQSEEKNDVLPLSQARAQAVLKFLVQFGVDEKRLSALGRGSSEPVVSFKDADNRWKNRRVEFILEK